jgi:hypothetical protein
VTRRQIGTVSILRERVYPRGGSLGPDGEIVDPVAVDPGVWPVYRDDSDMIYWEMTGTLVRRRSAFVNFGDGMFAHQLWDEPTGEGEVIITSMRYTPAGFTLFRTNDPLALPGPEQRLVFDVKDEEITR